MSDAQQDHALAIESVAPDLADLRIELCPSHMNEGCFWKIYFVLLHPKLTKEDAEIVSTPQTLGAVPNIIEFEELMNDNLPNMVYNFYGSGVEDQLVLKEKTKAASRTMS